jgi:hypothetical protein
VSEERRMRNSFEESIVSFVLLDGLVVYWDIEYAGIVERYLD